MYLRTSCDLHSAFRSVCLHVMTTSRQRKFLPHSLRGIDGFRTLMSLEEICYGDGRWIKVALDHAQWPVLAQCLSL
jgi:hypothetical protein